MYKRYLLVVLLLIILPHVVAKGVEDGSSGNPYLVSSMSDLMLVGTGGTKAGTTGTWDLDDYYEQTEDIDCDNTFVVIGDPVGTAYGIFSGEYNGGGYKTRNASATVSRYAGLFAAVSGRVYDLGLESPYFRSTVERAGGIVGRLIPPGKLEYCYVANGTVTSDSGSYIGGLVGIIADAGSAYVDNCYFTGSVLTPSTERVGGLVGAVSASTVFLYLTNSYAIPDFGSSLIEDVGGVSWETSSGNVSAVGAVVATGTALELVGNGPPLSIASSSFETLVDMKKQVTYVTTEGRNWNFTSVWQIQENVTYPYFRGPHPIQDAYLTPLFSSVMPLHLQYSDMHEFLTIELTGGLD
jgi:hypothetical protein